jgi:hypothetical protein
MVVLLPASEGEPSLHPAAVSKLADLGVTSVAVVRDLDTVGLIVEGWAFEPKRSERAVVDAVAGPMSGVRTLYPLLQLAVSASALENGGEPQ